MNKLLLFVFLVTFNVPGYTKDNNCIPDFIKSGADYTIYNVGPVKVLGEYNDCWAKVEKLPHMGKSGGEKLWVNLSNIEIITKR